MGSETAGRKAQMEEHLDRAAHEVFSTMMAVNCMPAAPEPEGETLSAVIGLAGALSGTLVLRAGRSAAERIAERLTGAAAEDAVMRDALGEVCNMVAGGWKSFDPKLSCGCLLSTPTVVAGSRYELFCQRASIRIERAYRFEDRMFSLTLSCEEPA